jgi:hypothetical protein
MTVAYESVGVVASDAGTALAPGTISFSGTGIPSGSGAGFLAVIFWGNSTNAPPTYNTSTWTLVADAEGGSGAGAWTTADSHTRHVSTYFTDTNITGTTQTFVNGGTNDTGNMILGYIVRVTKTLTYFDIATSAEASDNVGSGAFSQTCNTNPGGTTGDLGILAVIANTDAVNPASLTFTWTGATLGTNTSIVTTPSTAGHDSRVAIRYRTVTAGTASAAPAVTSSTTFTGAALITRLRDTNTSPAVPPVANAGGDILAEPYDQGVFTLDGSASSYVTGATFQWSDVTVGGTGTVTIINSTSLVASAYVTPTEWADEDYTFELEVVDAGGTDTDERVVTVLRSATFVTISGTDHPTKSWVEY